MADIKPDIKPENNDGLNVEHRQRDDRSLHGRSPGRYSSEDGNAGFSNMNFNEPMEHGGASKRRRRKRKRRGRRGGFGPGDHADGLRRFEDRRVMEGVTKFSSRCRLYIGNFCDPTVEEVTEMLKEYGEVNEVFVNTEKMFAFVRLDYRVNAERAKRELNGNIRKNRPLKVRFAPLVAAIKVKNLTPWVTNELLEDSFSVFGKVEQARIVVDARGNSVLEGIVEFKRKPMALNAINQCTEGCFFLTNSLRPVIVEPYDEIDDIDGFSEKSITKKPIEYLTARKTGPRFATPNSFEFEYGLRWKNMFELFKEKEESLKRVFKWEEEKLEAQMEYARLEHEIEEHRELLKRREEDRERQKMELKLKVQQADDQIKIEEEDFSRQAEEMKARFALQEEGLERRKKDNNIFFQNRMNNRHVMDLDRNGSNFKGNATPPQMDVMNVDDHFDERNDGQPGLRGSRDNVPALIFVQDSN